MIGDLRVDPLPQELLQLLRPIEGHQQAELLRPPILRRIVVGRRLFDPLQVIPQQALGDIVFRPFRVPRYASVVKCRPRTTCASRSNGCSRSICVGLCADELPGFANRIVCVTGQSHLKISPLDRHPGLKFFAVRLALALQSVGDSHARFAESVLSLGRQLGPR